MSYKKSNYPTPSSQQLTMFEREAPYPTPEPVAQEAPPPQPATTQSDTNANRESYEPTKLGCIPVEWTKTKLRNITSKITVGIATEVRPHITERGVLMIRNQNIKIGYFDSSDMIYISEEFDLSNKSKRVKASDVLVVRTGSNVGQACVVPKEFADAQTFTTLIVRPKEVLDSSYLSFHINSFGIAEVERLSAGGGKPNLNAGFLKEYRINIPPLPEQRAIADCLSTWDRAVQTLTQLIAQRELRKKWLMQQLLTGKKRLPGFGGEWRKVKISQIMTESKIPSENPDPARRISVKLSLNGVEKREERGTEAKDSTAYFIRKAGQFIYGKQNLHKGAFGIIPIELDGFESTQDIPSFDFTDVLNPNWFLYFIGRESFYLQLEKISTGTGSKRIHPKNLFKLVIQIPPPEEQTAIAQVLHRADQEITLLNQKLTHIQDQKKGLMQQLLTGRKRLTLKTQ